jgi:hypothetical protein
LASNAGNLAPFAEPQAMPFPVANSVHSVPPFSDVLSRPTCLTTDATSTTLASAFRELPSRAACDPRHIPACNPEFAVAAANWFRYTYLSRLAKPKSDRPLYRLIKTLQATRIIEIGMGELSRAMAMIEVAQRFAGDKKVWYTGIDLFEARPAGMLAVPLKEAYRQLRSTDAGIRLVPGTPARSLASAANAHPNTDIILIGHEVTEDDLVGAWFYVPRMLHANSVILSERRDLAGQTSFEPILRSQIAERAARESVRRAA